MSEWISVKDRLPEMDKDILICDNGIVRFGIFSKCLNVYKFFTTNFEQFLDTENVSHWMPFPEAPKEK